MKAGDKVWTVTSVLREGVVIEPKMHLVIVETGNEQIALPYCSVFTTIEAALKECVECRDYWERQIMQLNDLLAVQSLGHVPRKVRMRMPRKAEPHVGMLCQKCGCEVDDMMDCCPGCLDPLHK